MKPFSFTSLLCPYICFMGLVLSKKKKKCLNKLHFQSLSSENIYCFMIVFQVILANFPSSVFLSQEPSSPLSQTHKTLRDKKLDFSNTNCWQLSALYWGITDCSFNELSLIHWGWIIFNAELFSSNWPRIPAVKSTCQIMLVYKYISRQQKSGSYWISSGPPPKNSELLVQTLFLLNSLKVFTCWCTF